MIEIAKKYFPKANYFEMCVSNLKFEDETFNLVVCKDSFHHFAKPVKALKEMYRVTKRGGTVYITDLRRDSSSEVICQVIQAIAQDNLKNAMQYVDSIRASYTIDEMKNLLRKAKIKSYRIWTPRITKNFCKEYNINPSYFLLAANYFRDRWTLLIKKI